MLDNPFVRGVFLAVLSSAALIAHLHYAPKRGARAGSEAHEPRVEASAASAQRVLVQGPRILMIGNSHSAPIPRLLTQMAAAAGIEVSVDGRTPGGTSFKQHAEAPNTLGALRAKKYDVVTLQDQGQQAAFLEHQRLRDFYPPGEALVAAVRATGAEPVLYAVYARPGGDTQIFPDDTYEAMQDRSDEGYANLARRTGTRVIPVGRAFRNAHALSPGLALWQPDGMHATPLGFYLVAAVFFAALLDRDPSDVAFDAELSATDAAFLRRTAAQVVETQDPTPAPAAP